MLGVLFAIYTPLWQAPDEPAHFNYVRHLAEVGDFPVLEPGDYNGEYLDLLKTHGFSPQFTVDPVQYEDYQLPLYYTLAAPLYTASGGSPLALRLFSVLLGAGVVYMAFAVAMRVFPRWSVLALGTAAFVAFLPQHLASASQIGNDMLAELWVGLGLYLLIGRLQRRGDGAAPVWRADLGLGLVLAAATLTKITAYLLWPLALGVLLWEWRQGRAGIARITRTLAAVIVPSLLLGVPWVARNLALYGWPDFLGLGRHDAVVTGQLTLAEYLARSGPGSYLQRLVDFTFRSFWGFFGWLQVAMDERIYVVLAALTLAAGAGLLLHEIYARRTAERAPHATRLALRLLLACVAVSLLFYAGYNVKFVQHQGRYLFNALIPLGIAFGLGWDEALRSRSSRVAGALLAVAAVVVALGSLAGGNGLPKWPVALLLAAAAALALLPMLPARLRTAAFAFPYLLLPLVALYALFGAIVPGLAR